MYIIKTFLESEVNELGIDALVEASIFWSFLIIKLVFFCGKYLRFWNLIFNRLEIYVFFIFVKYSKVVF